MSTPALSSAPRTASVDTVRGAVMVLMALDHVPGFAVSGKLFIGYPLVPWAAVMAVGWALVVFLMYFPAAGLGASSNGAMTGGSATSDHQFTEE